MSLTSPGKPAAPQQPWWGLEDGFQKRQCRRWEPEAKASGLAETSGSLFLGEEVVVVPQRPSRTRVSWIV